MIRLSRLDLALLLMSLIWGSNYSIVKHAFREMPPQAFNALRLLIASTVFLAVIRAVRRMPGRALHRIFYTPAPITRRDWLSLIGLGIVGHFVYQWCFIGGLARTSVANSSLILSATPVVVAGVSALMGHERISRLHWAGAGLSVVGIYLVVGRGPELTLVSLGGDALMLIAVICWASYTIGAGRLMARHSPLGVTGFSMAIGTMLYVPAALPSLTRVDWDRISAATWVAVVYSSLFALCVAYMIWYIAVQRIGGARTSVYSNLIPLVAMAVAALWLGEPLTRSKIAGAAAVIAGVALTRASGGGLRMAPAEE